MAVEDILGQVLGHTDLEGHGENIEDILHIVIEADPVQEDLEVILEEDILPIHIVVAIHEVAPEVIHGQEVDQGVIDQGHTDIEAVHLTGQKVDQDLEVPAKDLEVNIGNLIAETLGVHPHLVKVQDQNQSLGQEVFLRKNQNLRQRKLNLRKLNQQKVENLNKRKSQNLRIAFSL